MWEYGDEIRGQFQFPIFSMVESETSGADQTLHQCGTCQGGKQAEAPEMTKTLPTGNKQILFVDDEPSMVRPNRHRIERFGYNVTTETDPINDLALFRSGSDGFDLVRTSMTMPHMTGDKLAQELMKIRPDIPIILCTRHSGLVAKEKTKDMGIKVFVMKPVSTRVMAETVRDVLDEK